MLAPSNRSRPCVTGRFRLPNRTTGVALAAFLGLVLLLTGCSPSSSDQPDPGSPSGAGTVTEEEPPDPNAGLKNGTQLKKALLTKADLPAGYKVAKDYVRDSAEVWGDKSKPTTPTKADCKHIDTNVWVNGAGIGSAAFAQTAYTNGYGNEIDAEIDAYRGRDAAKVMTNLRKLFSVCATYNTTTPGVGRTKVKVTRKVGPKLGDSSVKALATSKDWADGATLIAVQVDTSVVTILYSSSTPASQVKAQKLAQLMVKRLSVKA